MTEDKEELVSPSFYFDYPFFYQEGKIFHPQIFEDFKDKSFFDQLPASCNTICFCLDGKLTSDLNWKIQRDLAREAIERGYKLVWKLNLGLFSQLNLMLQDETQFHTLLLALTHFYATLAKEFKDHTLGLSIFEGKIPFSAAFCWDAFQVENYQKWLEKKQVRETPYFKDLFCRDVIATYLALLIEKMPDSLPIFLILEVDQEKVNQGVFSNLALIQLTARDCFNRLIVIAKQNFQSFSLVEPFNHPLQFDQKQPIKIGICWPSDQLNQFSYYEDLGESIDFLNAYQLPFRIIPEEFLIAEWAGLDYLLYSSRSLSKQGERKLQGFCAAGGLVIEVHGHLKNFSNEMEFTTFKELWLK